MVESRMTAFGRRYRASGRSFTEQVAAASRPMSVVRMMRVSSQKLPDRGHAVELSRPFLKFKHSTAAD